MIPKTHRYQRAQSILTFFIHFTHICTLYQIHVAGKPLFVSSSAPKKNAQDQKYHKGFTTLEHLASDYYSDNYRSVSLNPVSLNPEWK